MYRSPPQGGHKGKFAKSSLESLRSQSRCLLKRREKIEYPIPMFSFWSAEYRARFRVVGPLISCGVVGLQENIR